MPLLSEQDAEFLKKDFNEKLKNNVKLIFFKAEDACLYCKEVKDILAEVVGLSDKLSLEEYDFDKDTDKVKLYGIKRTPAIVIEGDKDYGVRFYGMPAGHEFMTLVNGIINVSTKETGLSEKTIEKLKEITKPYNIQVFVTPTWPHCPPAAVLAHSFAIANENITSDVIEIQEFPNLSDKYEVFSVPKTVMNESAEVVGAVPESVFLGKVMEGYANQQ